jgi:branched-chain amino acid transport system substrate-binding protein
VYTPKEPRALRRPLLIGLVAVPALLLAACSSSSGSSQPAKSTAAGSSGSSASASLGTKKANPNLSTIKIGEVVGVTGAQTDNDKGVPPVAKAWQDWVNNNLGGINGHPVQVVIQDDQSTAAMALSAAQTLIQQDQVVAAVGSADGGNEAVFTKPFVDANIPTIGAYLDPGTAQSSPLVFSTAVSAINGLKISVDQAKMIGAADYADIICSEYSNCSGLTSFQKSEAATQGIKWDGYVSVAGSAPNFNAACLSLQSKNVSDVFLGVVLPTALRAIQDCTQQGFTPQYYAEYSSTVDANLLPLTKGSIKFAVQLLGFPWWTNTPAVVNYRNVVAAYAPSGTDFGNSGATGTWSSLELFRQALDNDPSATSGATVSSAQVLAALDNVNSETLGGLLPQAVTYTAGKIPAPINCTWVSVFADQKYGTATTICTK